MVNRIYPPELQLNKANTADTEAPFLDLYLSISNGFVSSKNYDKRDDFSFRIVNFPFLNGDVPYSASYGVYISQPFWFPMPLIISLTAKLLNRAIGIINFERLSPDFIADPINWFLNSILY